MVNDEKLCTPITFFSRLSFFLLLFPNFFLILKLVLQKQNHTKEKERGRERDNTPYTEIHGSSNRLNSFSPQSIRFFY